MQVEIGTFEQSKYRMLFTSKKGWNQNYESDTGIIQNQSSPRARLSRLGNCACSCSLDADWLIVDSDVSHVTFLGCALWGFILLFIENRAHFDVFFFKFLAPRKSCFKI
jgi:hypothetical protein